MQGGDWGGPIIAHMARADAEHVVGMHTETCRGGPPEGVADPTAGVPADELERMRERQAFFSDEERGYSAIQGSKPQTLGYGLNDSPIGQAAWIVEKFRAWSDVGGDVESKFTRDELLTNVTIYWVTQTATSSARLYYERPRQGSAGLLGAADRGAHGLRGLPRRRGLHAAVVERGALQRDALHPHAAGRPLRGVGGAGDLSRRGVGVLQGFAVGG